MNQERRQLDAMRLVQTLGENLFSLFIETRAGRGFETLGFAHAQHLSYKGSGEI
jgi:hypothetical protein